jgi:3-oxoacyl-[acyl-carrier protein] reductase
MAWSIDEEHLAAVDQEIRAGGGDVLALSGDVGADDFPKKIVDATVQRALPLYRHFTHRKYRKINHIVNNGALLCFR